MTCPKLSRLIFPLLLFLGLTACLPQTVLTPLSTIGSSPTSNLGPELTTFPQQATPLPVRERYLPATLVDYIAQSGDTLPALAAHFNTTQQEIRQANPILPADVTTLPPGLPLQIPIYYAPFWASPFKILPDALFVDGPAQIDFDTRVFIQSQPGWLKNYSVFAADAQRDGANMIDYLSQTFSISPRLLLALLEYQLGALSQPKAPDNLDAFTLDYAQEDHRGLYLQLIWAANVLNNGYYGWRTGDLTRFELPDGSELRPDPWQNAASVALQTYFANYPMEVYQKAVSPQGFFQTYTNLFGDPWQNVQKNIPGSLAQPEMVLPFESGRTWAYTGGPHTAWGTGQPLAAIDFAPPSVAHGCFSSPEWVVAVADGLVVRSETGIVVLDLDKDGDERTGWVIFYLHIGTNGRAKTGQVVSAGEPIGHPSCEGGRTTGTHVHFARKYNGEWVSADGPLAFNLSGWIAHNGNQAYAGTLTRYERTITACDCANAESLLTAPP